MLELAQARPRLTGKLRWLVALDPTSLQHREGIHTARKQLDHCVYLHTSIPRDDDSNPHPHPPEYVILATGRIHKNNDVNHKHEVKWKGNEKFPNIAKEHGVVSPHWSAVKAGQKWKMPQLKCCRNQSLFFSITWSRLSRNEGLWTIVSSCRRRDYLVGLGCLLSVMGG